MQNSITVNVIGAGLAGCEAAYFLVTHGVNVNLFDIKPHSYTPAHKSEKYAELVCSNSLKSNDVYGNACGLLKEEMRILGSLIIDCADKTRVPAGNALAVDREAFSSLITDRIKANENITFISKEITEIDYSVPTIIATGVASPNAHGQLITNTEIPRAKANPTVSPQSSHTNIVITAMEITTGTNTPDTLSAIFAIGALVAAASLTI